MELLGYSERGLINALLHEIAYREPGEAQELVQNLFKLIKWPGAEIPEGSFDKCNAVLVEQSFSDFGDADGLFLFTHGENGVAVFLEGKRGKDYKLERVWKKFIGSYRKTTRYRGLTSNLFCQIYFKQRLAIALRSNSDEDVDMGLSFEAPFNLPGRERKIGDNCVVRGSVERLRKHLGKVYFLLMVPEPWTDELKSWWDREVADADPAPSEWDVSCWGILSIPDIAVFCRDNKLCYTSKVFNHNRGQLYVELDEHGGPELAQWAGDHGNRGVAVVYAPKINPNTSIHFSWAGTGCAFRDYSEATSEKPPKPDRRTTSDAASLIEKFESYERDRPGVDRIVEWQQILIKQNKIWQIPERSGT